MNKSIKEHWHRIIARILTVCILAGATMQTASAFEIAEIEPFVLMSDVIATAGEATREVLPYTITQAMSQDGRNALIRVEIQNTDSHYLTEAVLPGGVATSSDADENGITVFEFPVFENGEFSMELHYDTLLPDIMESEATASDAMISEATASNAFFYNAPRTYARMGRNIATDSEAVEEAGSMLVNFSVYGLLRSVPNANENMMNAFMISNTSVSGNIDYSTPETDTIPGGQFPGAWRDYVNTIWQQKSMDSFSWTTDEGEMGLDSTWAFSGEFAYIDINPGLGNTPDVNAKVKPSDSGTAMDPVFQVYSADQLYYALSYPYSEWSLNNPGMSYTNMTRQVNSITIQVMKNINCNGMTENWKIISGYRTNGKRHPNIILEGNHNTVYNLGSFVPDVAANNIAATGDGNAGMSVGLMCAWKTMTVSDLSFVSAKLVAGNAMAVGIFGSVEQSESVVNGTTNKFENITIKDSLFFNYALRSWCSPLGTISLAQKQNQHSNNTINLVAVEGCSVYGGDHVAGLSTATNFSKISNSYVTDTKLVTYGGHSGGFISCHALETTIHNCFTNLEMYAGAYSGGFIGLYSGDGDSNTVDISDCFSTGKLEGYYSCGGFSAAVNNEGVNKAAVVERCYSTMLVGMREESQNMGGFHAPYADTDAGVNTKFTTYDFNNCYAAGEVGSVNTDLNTTASSLAKGHGGFFTITPKQSSISTTTDTTNNCYYDKQTTGMREWVTSDFKKTGETGGPIEAVGVLTTAISDTASPANTIAGLTSSKAEISAARSSTGSDKGFQGFDGFDDPDDPWIYDGEHYPQLRVFAEADLADGWSASQVNTVRANSQASTATVHLDTWSAGYEWDQTNGQRTMEPVNYYRDSSGQDYYGDKYTYDTVRDIISDFYYSSGSHMESQLNGGGGAYVRISDTSDFNVGTVQNGIFRVEASSNRIDVNLPGVDWYSIQTTSREGAATRPIRLISYTKMGIETGYQNKTVLGGETYDHREGLNLIMLNRVIDNLVVGLNDLAAWAEMQQKYFPNTVLTPSGDLDYYDEYYDLETTEFNSNAVPAGMNAILNSEVWAIEQTVSATIPSEDSWSTEDKANYNWVQIDAVNYPNLWGMQHVRSGNWKETVPVEVNGPQTAAAAVTVAQKKWRGEMPLYADVSEPTLYSVRYFWIMKDGRYRTDNKTVLMVPNQYEASIKVENYDNNDPNATALDIGVAQDNPDGTTGYILAAGDSASISNIPNGENITLAWKQNTLDEHVYKIMFTMTGINGENGTTMELGTISKVFTYGAAQDDVLQLDLSYDVLNQQPVDRGGGYEYIPFNNDRTTVFVKYAIQKVGDDFQLRLNDEGVDENGNTVDLDQLIGNAQVVLKVIKSQEQPKIHVTVPMMYGFAVVGSIESSATSPISVENGNLLLPNVKVDVIVPSSPVGAPLSGSSVYTVSVVSDGSLKAKNYSTGIDAASGARVGMEVSLEPYIRTVEDSSIPHNWKITENTPTAATSDFKKFRLGIDGHWFSEKDNYLYENGEREDVWRLDGRIDLQAPSLIEGWTAMGTARLPFEKDIPVSLEVGGVQNQYKQVEQTMQVAEIIWNVVPGTPLDPVTPTP